MSEPSVPAFDYHGALLLARRLVRLADDWDMAFAARAAAFEAALSSWTGPYRDEVARRLAHERSLSEAATSALRLEADRWARAWAEAVDDGNRALWFSSTVSLPEVAAPAPLPTGIPVAPHYQPTSPLPGTGR